MAKPDERFDAYYIAQQQNRDLEHSLSVRQYYNSPIVGVVVPFLQSLVTALLVTFVTAALLLALDVTAKKAWSWAFVASTSTALLTWLRLIVKWTHLVHSFESILGIDINRDGLS